MIGTHTNKYNKSMELESVSKKLSNRLNSYQLSKTKDKQAQSTKNSNTTQTQVRKTKSKPSYKPQTTQINLFTSSLTSKKCIHRI